MTKTEFKKAFGSTAESYGFRRIYSCWITESPERIFVLMLQKSNFGNYYDLMEGFIKFDCTEFSFDVPSVPLQTGGNDNLI